MEIYLFDDDVTSAFCQLKYHLNIISAMGILIEAYLFIATGLGIPVSTTHTITGAIIGVGLSRRVSAVRWGVAARIVWAWVLTIPCAGLIAALCYELVQSAYVRF